MIIGLDVGGTHTDVVLLGNEGVIRDIKVATDSSNLFNSVLTGLEEITEGIDSKDISRTVLSTTITTNAIVQDKIQEVGMIVSGGPGIDPEYFRTNRLYYPVAGSIDHRGREVEQINEKEIKSVAEILKKEGIRNVGIVGKFSVRNPAHELKIYELIKDSFGKIFMGHQVSGNLNFPRRISTTFLNATVRQIYKKFYEAVIQSLEKKGLSMPIYILKADGGTMKFESSAESPAQTILSGPAASVIGSVASAQADEDTLVLDIGGTTTDMAILINKVPVLAPQGITLGKYKTLIRSLETLSIGLGGDSVVRVKDKNLTIGPDRMGPAMAFGGDLPTPTDALVTLGIMEIGDKEKAKDGIDNLAKSLGISSEDTANKIFDLTCQEILKQAWGMIDRINSKPVYTVHEIQEGYQIKPKKILVLGGPAPYFAKRLEELSNVKVNLLPKWGVANAIGAALARTTCEVTLFADTQQGFAMSPEEKYSEKIGKDFSKQDVVKKAYDLLKQKATNLGAISHPLDMEVLEDLQFNMIRGFYTAGKNIRVKVQVKPGLISGYEKYCIC